MSDKPGIRYSSGFNANMLDIHKPIPPVRYCAQIAALQLILRVAPEPDVLDMLFEEVRPAQVKQRPGPKRKAAK